VKITFVLPVNDLSGGIRVLATHAERLARRGHEVFAVSVPVARPRLGRAVKDLLRGRGWPASGGPVSGHFDLVDVPHHRLERDRAVSDADVPDADVAIASWWKTAQWVHALSPAKGARVHFVQAHEVLWYSHRPDLREQVEAVHRLPFQHVTVSRWLEGILRNTYGREFVDLVPNSVDVELFHAPPRGRQPVPTVGFQYGTLPLKGSDTAARAIGLVRQRIPELRVLAFGAERPTPALPVPPGTEFFESPPQHRIRDLYAQCDAWLFTGRNEGFGLTILEAMACRTPVIGTRTGAAPELLAGGGGALVRSNCANEVAQSMLALFGSDEATWRRLSDAAHATVSTWTWDHACGRLEDALLRAVERQRHRMPEVA
jgi:glycosyltransferase involved in cell wall biosynthesis